MNFNNVRNINALLDKEDQRDKYANHLTDMFSYYLNKAHDSAMELNVLNKEFNHYYTTTVPETIKPDVNRTISDYLKREWDKINTTVGGIQTVLDFLEGALKNPKYAPVVEESVGGAGLEPKPEQVKNQGE